MRDGTLPLLLLLLLPTIIIAFRSLKIGRKQSTAVRGVLMCNDRPAVNIKMKLYNDGQGRYIKDFMDEGTTDSEGHFLLKGHEISIIDIQPMLELYHDCGDENGQCLKKFSRLIPEDFISEGSEPTRTFDTGTLNLAGKFFNEGRKCIS
uniref:Transthyretin-like family protein n=1 Tax=Elaeophora elaphi TaxID=1147741 RepID=A0A0R3RTN1_9BILA